MSDRFTNGVAVGTDLAVYKAVKRTVVRENGLMVDFKSPYGEETRKLIQVSVDEYSDWLNGTPIQYAMPNLSADDRELFLTGMSW